jgi:hypothetical protein
MGSASSVPCPGRFTHGKDPVNTSYRRVGGPPGPVWTGAANLVIMIQQREREREREREIQTDAKQSIIKDVDLYHYDEDGRKSVFKLRVSRKF